VAEVLLRPTQPGNSTVAGELARAWGTTVMAVRGELVDCTSLPGLLAYRDGSVAGALTYRVDNDELEVVSLHAVDRHGGAGSALLAEAVRIAREAGARRVFLATTNDNVDALRFYQRRGMRIAEVRIGGVDAARDSVKPGIPLVGEYGIEMHDEITMELTLA
jgi:ribosomal protein S18 acetylase RimI-like enzyme